MANLSARLERLEAGRSGGVLLFSWESSGGKATAVIDGERHTQSNDETRDDFLARVQPIAARGRKAVFLWVGELDARL